MNAAAAPKKLWNRNFTIITLGTVVSMLGNAISGFAISLLILDYTQSVFLYSLFMVVYNLPKIIMPLFIGPYLDNFSRSKVIYTLDFCSAAIYLGLFVMLSYNYFSYVPLLIITAIIGSIDSIYQVAYDSLYPTLISKENYSKAYSISSIIYPLSAVMVPLAAYIYESFGNLAPLFAFNAATFLVAAIAETFIRADESHIKKREKKFGMTDYFADFRAGIRYIRAEKGLMVITAYFFVTMFASACSGLVLPWFKSEEGLGVVAYTYVMGSNIFGRLVGGLMHYKLKIPPKFKFFIAISVYTVISVIEGGYLFTPYVLMIILMFTAGFLAVNSFNIRISATQSYVPNSYRGRFNGAFQMILAAGTIIGQLSAGALAEFMPIRTVTVIYYAINLAAVFGIMYVGRRYVKPIYNATYELKENAGSEQTESAQQASVN